jgi:hypothetical protein
MALDGFGCTTADVWNVYRNGTLSTNEALASRILQEFDEYGVDDEVTGLADSNWCKRP